MARKPVHLELAGGKGPRQRIWENIRRFGETPFGLADITPGGISIDTTRTYVQGLEKAGIVTPVSTGRGAKTWTLTADTGVEAPRVRRDGTRVIQGDLNEAMWGAMQAHPRFTALVLATLSGATVENAKSYCVHLAKAGYLAIEREGKGMGKGGIPTTYRFLQSRNTGPRAPMVTRLKAVYDPNEHRFAWQTTPDEVVAEMEV